jgi:CubicO group peptidase (beta-lactamase class C family)
MSRTRSLLCVLPLLLAPWACAAAQGRPEVLAQALLDALHETSGVPGLGAAVWQDGRLRWQGQAGWQDLTAQRPLGPDTRFRLASVSKLFTATAAAQLHQEGRLHGEAPLPQPWYPADHPGARITLRQLAAHTSGLPHYELRDLVRGGQAFPDSRSAARHWLNERALRDEPGRSYHYSSWGYTLLGATIEQASNLPLDRYFEARLTQGLAIGVDRTDTDRDGHSRPYEAGARGWRLASAHDYSYSLGGAGLSATPGALAQWGGRLLQGQLLDADTLAWMMRPSRLADGSPVRHDGANLVAFGWRLRDDPQGRPTWFHNGSAVGARSALVLWPGAPATAAALLSNAAWVSAIDDSARTLAAVFLPETGKPPTSPWVCPAAGQRFTGRWGNQALQGTVKDSPGVPGPCARHLQLDHPPTGFDNQGPPRAAVALRLIALPSASGVVRAGLATPIGLFMLDAAGAGLLRGKVAGRDWEMRW